jgi:hypothetical protein
MVICEGQLDSVVPLEPATMPGRVVIQWDKEDCADMGSSKWICWASGMMAVLEESIQLIRTAYREEVDLAHLPQTTRWFIKRCKTPTPSECFRWKAARRCRACLACGPNISTTSWCKWPSSGPGPLWVKC